MSPLTTPAAAVSLAPYYVETADSSAIANTTTETAFSVGPSAFAANQLTAGTVVRVRAWGLESHTAGPTITFRWQFASGPVSLMLHSASAIGTATNAPWTVEATLVVRSAGASGSIQTTSEMTREFVSPGSISVNEIGTSTATVDTTASQTLQLTAKWSAASASDTITCTGFVVEKLQ